MLPSLRALNARIAKKEQLMQRSKHATRKQRTRTLILFGAAVERAGAAHLDPAEIEAVLAHYVAAGGDSALNAAVAAHLHRSTMSGSEDGTTSARTSSLGQATDPVREPVR
ncbi:MAG: conjugal transfer protein TraD [Rhizobiaceae bacterium]|nr:conjugal transfer protein TraD [Rhizobiaceae bacterium]